MEEMAANQSQIEAPVETTESTPIETTAPVEGTTSPEQSAAEATETPKTIKIKYNGEEMDIPLDEATTLVQKGRNYEKAVERAQREAAQKARDSFIAEQGYEWNGQAITTEAQYRQALQEKAAYDQMQEQDMTPEQIQRELEIRRREQVINARESQWQQQVRINGYLTEFREAYPDVGFDDIPDDVKELVRQTKIPLLDAYNRIELPRILARKDQAIAVKEQNLKNADTSPGGVAGQGGIPSDYISQETFEQKKHDQRWVINNLSAISKSRAKW